MSSYQYDKRLQKLIDNNFTAFKIEVIVNKKYSKGSAKLLAFQNLVYENSNNYEEIIIALRSKQALFEKLEQLFKNKQKQLEKHLEDIAKLKTENSKQIDQNIQRNQEICSLQLCANKMWLAKTATKTYTNEKKTPELIQGIGASYVSDCIKFNTFKIEGLQHNLDQTQDLIWQRVCQYDSEWESLFDLSEEHIVKQENDV